MGSVPTTPPQPRHGCDVLTPAQEATLKERADLDRAAFIREHLSEEDKWVQSKMAALHIELKNAQRGIKEQQGLCSHPLISRVIKNEGSSGNWDRDDSYWTSHRCEICDLRWSTDQSWNSTGDRLGLPDNTQGKDS
jgi:hypothetical protein